MTLYCFFPTSYQDLEAKIQGLKCSFEGSPKENGGSIGEMYEGSMAQSDGPDSWSYWKISMAFPSRLRYQQNQAT